MYTKQTVYQQDYSCILDPINQKGGLYIGNLQAAQSINTLQKHSIKAVLTSCKGHQLNHPKHTVPYTLYIPGEDHQGFDLSRYFSQAASFIKECLQRTNLMVHCLGGVSRSVTLVLAYFIKHCGMRFQDAFDRVKARRKIICPNDGFIEQLKEWDRQHAGQTRSRSPSPPRHSHSHYSSLSVSPGKLRTSAIQKRLDELKEFRKSMAVSPARNPELYTRYSDLKGNYRASVSPVKQDRPLFQPRMEVAVEQRGGRIKRISSMNPQRSWQNASIGPEYERQRTGSSYSRGSFGVGERLHLQRHISNMSPLGNIQNRSSAVSTSNTTDIDKRIQQIRRKYQEYSGVSSGVGHRGDENGVARRSSFAYDQDCSGVYDRSSFMQALSSNNRMKRLTSFQEY